MEDLVPAQWTGKEATFEPNLEKHAKLVISHEEKACLLAGRCSGHWILSS